MFQMITCNLAALTIAMLFYAWRDNNHSQERKRRQLNERVSYLLWTVAQRV